MPKLNQIIAIAKGVVAESQRNITDVYKSVQKTAPFEGISRTYTPLNDDPSTPAGERLPSECKKVELRVSDVLNNVGNIVTQELNVIMTKDLANCFARADVVVDGVVVLRSVPVTTLITLEKKLTDIHTFVKNLPTLSAGETWTFDKSQDLFASNPSETSRTKKVNRPMVLSAATDKHPAQVQVVTEDVPAGVWRTVKYSGALESKRVNDLVSRVEKLHRAVKFARESANAIDCEMQNASELMDYIFQS